MKNFPCHYRAQPKSWISSELFEEWVKEIDRNFGTQKRKIGLIIDNCPAHPDVPTLDWVEMIFIFRNTNSITQPIDQEAIRFRKAKYRSLAVKKHMDALEKGNQFPKFSILTTTPMLTKAWNSIPEGTFRNSFKTSRISKKSMEVLNDGDDSSLDDPSLIR